MRPLIPILLLCTPLAAQETFPPVQLPTYTGMDPAVVDHIKEYVAKVAADPGNGELHAELGLVYEANTCFAPAAASYQNAIALVPEPAQWSYRLGVMQVSLGEYEEARKSLEAAAAKLRNTPVILARLGAVRLDLGDVEGAEEAWLQAIAGEAKQPQQIAWPQSRVGLAAVRMAQERFQEAATLLEEALAAYSTYRHAHYLYGLCLFELGEEERGELELKRGVSAWPEFPPDPHRPRLDVHAVGYHRRMMGVENLLRSGQLQQGMVKIQEMIAERPDDPSALNLLAKAQMMGGQLDASLETLRRSEQLDPRRVQTKIDLSVTLMNLLQRQQDPAKRAEVLGQVMAITEAAVKLAPRQGRVRFYRGMAYLMSAQVTQDGQQVQAAFSEVNLALQLGCQEPDLYARLVELTVSMGRQQDMLHFAKANADKHPDDPGAVTLLVRAQLTVGDLDGAEKTLVRLEAMQNPQLAAFIQQVKAHIAQQRAQQPASGKTDK